MLTPLGKWEGPNNLKLLPHIFISYKGKEKIPLLLYCSLWTVLCYCAIQIHFKLCNWVILQLNQRIKFYITSVRTNWHHMPFERMQWEVMIGCNEKSLDCKESQPKGHQSWVIIGRTDVEAETPILWPPDAKSWLIWKDPDAGKDWGQEEKGTTEDEMVGWHHWLNGHGFGWTPGVGDG